MKKIIISLALILVFSGLTFAAQPDDADLIFLDIKGMDIRDVLKILSQKSGLNIVADSEVSGTVTLYLKDVSVAEAIAIVASTNKLAYEQTGSLIRMMNEKDYERSHGKSFGDKTEQEVLKLNYTNAGEVGKALLEAKSVIGRVIYEDISDTIVMIDTPENIKRMKEIVSSMDVPLVTEVFPLDYAKAESLKDKIGEMVSKGGGSVEFDEKTNKLVVKDTRAKIEDVRKVINAFDEKIKQVLIETSIVQVMLLDKYSYGIDWVEFSKIEGVNLRGDMNLSAATLSDSAPAGLNIATTSVNYSMIEPLLKTYGETNVLSRPRLTVIDAQEAKIMVGAKEVYVTSDVTTTSGGAYHTADQVKFVDVGVRLAVTPEINRAGFIILKIKPEVSNADAAKTVLLKNPDGSTRAIVPYVTTSEAETSVVVKDGTTIIISGLMKDTLIDYKGGKIKRKTELVIFLTPHIIEGDSIAEDKEKYQVGLENKTESVKIAPEMEEPVLKKTEAKKRYADLKTPQPKSNIITKEAKKPTQKWTPILGTANMEAKNTGNSILGTKISEVENNTIPAAKQAATFSYANSTSYEEYYFALNEEINDLAKRDEDIAGIEGDVELEFTLDKEGFLIKGPIVLNNPDLRLVRSAVRVVKKAAPFGRFPKALKENQADFNVIVKYE